MKNFQKARKQVIYEGNFIRFVNKGGWEYIERSNCDGIVVIIAMTSDQKVLFVEQYRPPLDKNVIEFPAGLVNDQGHSQKETVFQAAQRELLEETGYCAKRMKKIFYGPINSGVSSDLMYFIRAVGIEKVGAGGGDATEEIKVHAIKLSQADQWLRKKAKEGVLICPRLYAGLYFLNKYNM